MDHVTPTTNAAAFRPIPPPPPIPQVPGSFIRDLFRPDPETVFDDVAFNPFDASFDVDGAAARAVAAYDRDGDGAIDVLPTHRHVGSSELFRHDDDGNMLSIARLARDADRRGNGDGSVTVEEMSTVIRGFDGGKLKAGAGGAAADGRIGGSERDRFLDRYGEVQIDRRTK